MQVYVYDTNENSVDYVMYYVMGLLPLCVQGISQRFPDATKLDVCPSFLLNPCGKWPMKMGTAMN